jgi:hypothetical protein
MNCCKDKECCSEHDTAGLIDILLISATHSYKLGVEDIRSKYYGFECTPGLNKELIELETYTDVLKKEYKKLQEGSKTCLDCESVQLLKEKILSITGKSCKPLCDYIHIDTSGEDEWIANNKYCISYNSYDKWAKICLDNIDISLTSETQTQNIVLELYVESVTTDILLGLSAVEYAKEANLVVERNDKETTKIDFELLVERHPNSNIDLKMYRKLVDKGLSFDVVSSVLNKDLELKIIADKVVLKTAVDVYAIENLAGKVDIKLNKYLQDYC